MGNHEVDYTTQQSLCGIKTVDKFPSRSGKDFLMRGGWAIERHFALSEPSVPKTSDTGNRAWFPDPLRRSFSEASPLRCSNPIISSTRRILAHSDEYSSCARWMGFEPTISAVTGQRFRPTKLPPQTRLEYTAPFFILKVSKIPLR